MDRPLFLSYMAYHGDTGESLSAYLEIHQRTFENKKSGKREFRLREIKMLAKKWNLSPQQVWDMFLKES